MSEPTYQVDLVRTADQPITEGVHPFTIVGFNEAEGDKGPYWAFTMRCDTPSEDGKTLMHYVSLTPQARWRLEIFLDAVKAPASGSATADKFVGRRLRGNVKHEPYNGRLQAKIQEMYPLSQEPSAPAAGKKTASVVAKKVTATVTQPELPTDVTQDDGPIPF